jgi:hypothetical protein
VICADSDKDVIEQALDATRAVGGFVATPTFFEAAGRHDVADLYVEQGLEAVRELLAVAERPISGLRRA